MAVAVVVSVSLVCIVLAVCAYVGGSVPWIWDPCGMSDRQVVSCLLAHSVGLAVLCPSLPLSDPAVTAAVGEVFAVTSTSSHMASVVHDMASGVLASDVVVRCVTDGSPAVRQYLMDARLAGSAAAPTISTPSTPVRQRPRRTSGNVRRVAAESVRRGRGDATGVTR